MTREQVIQKLIDSRGITRSEAISIYDMASHATDEGMKKLVQVTETQVSKLRLDTLVLAITMTGSKAMETMEDLNHQLDDMNTILEKLEQTQ